MKKFDYQKFISAESFIESLSSFEKIGQGKKARADELLNRTKLFLKFLSNPEKSIKTIHVAGTAGKGSVSKMIQFQIAKNGYKCGLYTSPHVISSTERIQINEKYISGMEYVEIVEELKPKIQKFFEKYNLIPSYFELNFAISLIYFKNKNCDFAVIETGMGGRFDCTNILKPILTVITNIGIDHTKYLGNTKEEIAMEKAGIIKEKTDLISAEKDKKIIEIFQKQALKKHSTATFINNSDAKIIKSFPSLIFENNNEKYFSKMLGESQVTNILLAKKVTEKLNLKFFNIVDTFLPARLEIIQKDPLIILDSAHNELKIQNFIKLADSLPHKKVHIIFALSEDKKLEKIIKLLRTIKKEKTFYLTKLPSMFKKSASFEDMQKYFKNEKSYKFIEPNLALNQALSQADKNTAILVTGSFYLSGYLRENFVKKEKILKTSNPK